KTGPASASAGTSITYTIVVSNAGPNTASDVRMADTLPAELTALGAISTQGACAVSGNAYTCLVGNLSAGQTATITINALVNSNVASGTTIQNSATATSATSDPDTANNASTTSLVVGSIANLSVNKTGDATGVAGQTVSYQIVVTNAGPSVANALVVNDVITGMQWLELSSAGVLDGSGTCAANALLAGVTCTLGNLGVGQTRTIALTFLVKPETPAGTVISDTAVLQSASPISVTGTPNANTTITRIANVTLSKTADKPTPGSGEVVKFTLSAQNAGPSVADGVTLTDTLPAGLSYVGSTCANIISTSPFVCWIGTVQPGDTASVDVNVRVDANVANNAVLTNTATLNNGAVATATVQARNVADVGMQKYGVAAGEVNAGDVMTYVIIATNYGPGVAYATTLSDTLSSDGAYNVTSITGATCAPGAGAYAGVTTFTCDAGTLAPNTEKIITFTMTALGNQTINNVVSASHAGEDPVADNNTASAQNRVRPVADLGIAKTGPAQVVAGDRMTYTLVISNTGPSIAEGVVVNDLLPGGVTLLGATASQGVCSNSPLACQMGNLASGASALITVVVKADSGLLDGATLINSASVSAQTHDLNTANNTSTATTAAVRSSALSVTKVDSADPVASGQMVVYSVNIRNDGPSDAKGVVLADTLDAIAQMYLQYIGATGAACMYTGAMALCSVGDIAAGNSALVQLTFQVKPGVASGMVFNDSLSLAAQTPISVSGDLTETTRVDLNVPPSLLSIVKEADKTIVEPGDAIQYTIRVANNSLVPTILRVTDTLPAGVTYVSDTCPDLVSSDNPILCDLLVGAQSISTFQIRVTVNDTVTNGLKLANVAEIAGRRPATATVTVRGVADVGIRKDAKPDGSVQTGQPITYYLTAYNNGPGVATNVYVTDTTTSDGAFNMSAPECSPASATGVSALALTCGPLTLANGEQHIFTVVATPTGSTRSINNQARIKADGRDPNTSNDTDSQQRQVIVLADVGVSKVGPASATAGTPISYTVLVSNTGYNTAQAVNLSDLLPPQIENVSFATTQGGCALNFSAWAVNCQLGDVTVGGQVTVTVFGVVKRDVVSGTMIVNGAQVTSQSADSNLANNTASAQTLVTDMANVAVNKTASSSSVVAGEVITYQISVANAGPSTAKDVVIHDVITGLEWLSLQSATSACAADLAGVTCNLGDVAPASARLIVLSFAVRADTPAGTVISDVAQIQSATVLNVSGTPTATTSVITQPGLRIAKVADTALASTGDVVKFTITTWNAGASVASSVVVTDALPAGLSFINTTCPAPLSTNPVVCAVGDLWPGQSASFDVNARVMPTVENQTALANVATLNDGQTASAVVLAQNVADLGVEKYGKPDTTVNAGETMTYTIIARNFGPGTAYGPIITDTLASNGAYDILAISGATCSPGTGSYSGATTFTCDLGAPLPAGAERIISMTVRALSNQSLNNTAWIHHNGVDPNPANDLAHVEHQVRPIADVGIRKTGPATATAGGLITYTLVVTNGGPSVAQGVVVNDFLPGGVTLLSAVASQGACGASPLQCALGDVAVNGSVSITVTGLADAGLPQGTVLLNTATVASATGDSNTGNNTSTASTVITRTSVLRVTKVDNLDPVMPGELLRYAIEITNFGPSDAANVRITDTMNAAAVQYLDLVSVTGGTCAQNSAVITCNAGDVATGASHIIEIAFTPKDVTPQGTVFSDSLNVSAVTPITIDPTSDLTETTQVSEPHLFLGNRVWYDTNNNGLLDDGAEFGVDGVRVELYKDTNMNEFFDPGIDQFVEYTTTSGGGFYLFNDVVAGDYFVVLTGTNFVAGGPLQNYLASTPVDLNTNNNVDNNNNGETIGVLGQNGYVAARMVSMRLGTEPQTLLRAGDTNRTVDFGFYQLSVGNRVWDDLNRNALDDGEPGLPGLMVTLTNVGTGAVFTTTTNANGYYTFTGVPSGTYVISVTLPAGYISVNDGALPADAVNADDDGRGTSSGTVGTLPFALTPGAEPVVTPSNGKTANWNVDFGAVLPIVIGSHVVIGNHVWIDTLTRDGIYAPSDIAAAGVVVELYEDVNDDGVFSPTIDVLVMTSTTDAGGYYTMSVLPGNYFAVITSSNFAVGGILQGLSASGPVSALDERNHGVTVGAPGSDGYVVAAVLTTTLSGGSITTTAPNDTYPQEDFAFSAIPTAIELAYFGVADVCEGAEIRWQTVREADTAGFIVYRSKDEDLNNAQPVSAQMTLATGAGGSYAVIDEAVKAGTSYTYWLAEIGLDGNQKIVAKTIFAAQGCVAGP
ncbi:MAG TPA: SdrD B-like domain-containing protein, partial [Thermoflexales bacterium]|nr:SdrD B-like domain-containing protein [Thermoflexales bacterium]